MVGTLDRPQDLAGGGDLGMDFLGMGVRDEFIGRAVNDHHRHGQVAGGIGGTDIGWQESGAEPGAHAHGGSCDRCQRGELWRDVGGGAGDDAIERGEGCGADDSGPARRMGGGGLQGDGTSLGHSVKEDRLLAERESVMQVIDAGLDPGGFVFPEAGGGGRVIAMAGELGGEAAETGGAEALADREVVLLATTVAVEHDDGAPDFAPRGKVGERLADFPAAMGLGATRAWFDEMTGAAAGTGVGSDPEPEGSRIIEAFAVVILQRTAGRRNDVARADPAHGNEGHRAQQEDDDEAAAKEFLHGWDAANLGGQREGTAKRG